VSSFVLDASALLAALHREPGFERWQAYVADGMISTVNLSEVIAKLLDAPMPVDRAVSALAVLNLTPVDFDRAQALAAAEVRNRTKHLGLSLGDRACLALARTRRLPVLTADRAWEKLKVGVEITLLR